MARGRFGRRRSSGANLTALIASLYQQQRAAEDRVMFDAYQNGGKGLDGKPVTDQTMRAYVAQRRDGFSKDDALYAEWGNRLTQLDFKIGEDKVTLAYQQGKVGAGAVASYYRGQLSKIPQDSEFYRTIAGRAAQWAKAAGSAARGRARGSLSRSLGGKSNAANKTQQDFATLEAYLVDAATRVGLIAGNQTLTDADATDLEAFLRGGVPGPKGTTITFRDWQQASIAKYKAFDTAIAINQQLGRGVKSLIKDKQKFLDQYLVRVNTVDDRAKYEIARETFQQTVDDAKGDPQAIVDATKAFASTLAGIRDTAAKSSGFDSVDPEFIGGINNELNAIGGKVTGPTVADLQSTDTEAVNTKDAQETYDSLYAPGPADKRGVLLNLEALQAGTAYYGQSDFGSGFSVQDFPAGSNLDPFGRNGLDDTYQAAIVNINGKPTQVFLKGQAVKAAGIVAPTGETVEQVGGVPIANMTAGQIQQLMSAGFTLTKDTETIGYVFQQNGKQTFGVKQADGSIAYTTQNPFDIAGSGDEGLVVVGGSYLTNSGDTAPVIPQLTVGASDAFMADESITPKDLRSLITAETNPQRAAELEALAAKRQQNADAERAYMARGRQGDRSTPSVLGPIGDQIRSAITTIQDTVRNVAAGPPTPDYAQGAFSPPKLQPLGPIAPTPGPAPSLAPAPTALAPTAAPTPTLRTAPKAVTTTTTLSTGKIIDDVANVSPTSGAAVSGGIVGAASADLLRRLQAGTTTTKTRSAGLLQ